MNHIYRVVFNRSLGVYQCVSELAKSCGKSSGKSQVATKLILAPLAIAMLGLSGTAFAADTVIDNGQRTQFNQNTAINGSALITGLGTVVAVPNHELNFGIGLNKATDVSLKNGATVEAKVGSLGANSPTTVTVDNAFFNAGALGIGANSKGNLNIVNGARLNVDTNIIMGFSPAASDFLSTLNINSGGKVATKDISVARLTGTKGAVSINGAGSKFTVRDTVIIGDEGIGNLTITNGGVLTGEKLSIANKLGSKGSAVKVNGAGSNITVTDQITVGASDTGTLSIDNKGQVAGDIVSIGALSRAQGVVSVNGADSVLNSSNVLIVGGEGVGTLNATNKATLNTSATEIGQFENGTGKVSLTDGAAWNNENLLSVGVKGKGVLQVAGPTTKLATDTLVLGFFDGQGEVNITDNATVEVNSLLQVGGYDVESKNSIGKIVVNDAQLATYDMVIGALGTGTLNIDGDDSYVLVANNLIIGADGTGTVNMNRRSDQEDTSSIDGSNLDVYGDTILGSNTSSEGSLNINGKEQFTTTNLVIGQKGKGTFTVKDTPYNIGLTRATDTTYIGGEGDDSASAIGTLTIDNSAFVTPNLIVGNTGSGTLNIINEGELVVSNIERNTASKLSSIFIDGGEISITEDQANLFANFGKNDQIKLGANGARFYTQGLDDNNQNIGTTVIINPNAIITGNVGKIDFETTQGGFAKYGLGTLEISESSKQWTGDLAITQGTLKFNGNYNMRDDETLVIGLLDWDEDGKIDDEYGKILVNGQIDISKGNLFVYADEVISNVAKDSEWKDIVKATTRKGEFTAVNDNSPLVSFYADYSDANAVHLKMGKPPVVVPPVKPEPPVVVPPVKPEPPVVVPPVKPEPPVVVPPVKPEPPVVVPPLKPEPPVVVPPLKPEPPVVVPPVKPEPPVVADITFVQAVNQQSNKTASGIASVLDKAVTNRVTTGNNVLADSLISNTINFNAAQLAAAANELQPSFMGATNRIITDTNYSVSNAIMEHRPTNLKKNIWAKLIGNKGSHDAENGVTGYEAESLGAIVGLDAPINSNLNLGMAVSYIDTDANTDGGRLDHDLTAKNWQVLGYGDYAASDATRVNFHAGAGSSDVKATRNLSVLTNSVASSDYDVDTLQAGLGISHRIGSEQRHVSPFTQVNYAHAKSDAYRETGAGVYNLNVDENKYESMRWTAGLNMSQLLTPRLAITGQLAAAIENGDKYSDITASFVDMPNDKFTTVGQEVGREIGIVGVGLSYAPTLNTTLSAGYRGEWRDNYDDHGASIALKTTF